MVTGKKRSFHWAWIILATCFADLFINYSVRLGYGVVLPEMIRTLGFDRTAGGSIYNAYLFSYIALTPLTGYLTDRFGARRVITICCLILSVGVLLMGTVKTLWTACLFYAVCGLGATGMWTPVITVVQRWFSIHRRGLALGILSTGYGLGFAVMGAVFPLIAGHFTWRFAWYFLGAGAVVMVLVNGLLLRSNPEESGYLPWGQQGTFRTDAADTTPQMTKNPLRNILKDNRFWLIGLSYLSVSYSLYGITTFMVDYAEYQMGFSLENASFLATVHGICQLIGVLTILPLSDVIGRKTIIIISNSFITLLLAGVLFTENSSILLYTLVGGIGVFYGVTFPIYGACAGDYFPKDVMGTVIGAWTPFYGFGAILVHWVTGVLRDTTGIYDYAFILNIIMAAIGLLLIFFVKKQKIID